MFRIAMTSLALGTLFVSYVAVQYLIGDEVNVAILCLASAFAGSSAASIIAVVKLQNTEEYERNADGVPSTWHKDKRDWR